MLGAFYPLPMVTGISEELGNPETIFNEYGLIHCFNCEACQLKSHCPYQETERVFMTIKEQYAESTIKQADLIDLLN